MADVSTSLQSLQKLYGIMAEAASSPGKVMLKRKKGDLMIYPHQTNQSQLSPLPKTLSATAVVMQVPENTHTYNHSYFPLFMLLLVIMFTMSITFYESTFINNFTMFTLL